MKYTDIKSVNLSGHSGESCRALMEGEVKDTALTYWTLGPGEHFDLPKCTHFARVLIVYTGTVAVSSGGETVTLHEQSIYVPSPDVSVKVAASADAGIIELRRYPANGESSICPGAPALPYVVDYDRAPTYSEDCKSEKTISRMLIPAGIITQFAMGSVQTHGDDDVSKHTHPMLEQFFLGLSDNDCTALIDDVEFPFHADTLLHIPRGSDHGIRSRGSQSVHYLWLDFLLDETGLTYMEQTHKMNE